MIESGETPSSCPDDLLRQTLELVNVPSYMLDAAGVVRWLNAGARRRVGDIQGRHFTAVVAPEDERRSRELFNHKLTGTRVTDADLVLVDQDGGHVAVELSSVPLHSGGEVVGVFGQIIEQRAVADMPLGERLTPRQAQVLELLVDGHSTRQIADELHLSSETVRNHVRHVLRALGVHSRLEAVAVARRTRDRARSRRSGHQR